MAVLHEIMERVAFANARIEMVEQAVGGDYIEGAGAAYAGYTAGNVFA